MTDGRLAENILHFARTLRVAGIRVGPAAAMDAVRAVQAAGIGDREDFYWTLHCVLVTRREDHAVFDEAFRLFWRPRDLVEKMLQMFSPMATRLQEEEARRAAQSRAAEALFSGKEPRREEREQQRIEIDARMTTSEREVLRSRDFAQMTAAEIALARRAMADLTLPLDTVRTRRFQAVARPGVIDPRRTLAASMRTGGDLILPKFRRHRFVQPPVVVLADISGSMSQYSRIFLHFLHALMEKRRRVHGFLFGTRLTNVSRQLRRKDPDEALAEVSRLVDDWSGGTRIGTALAEFNRLWSRRVLGQGAIVLLITDGLERDVDAILSREMDRLHRSCRRLIWLNPLLRFEGFEARAHGIRTMLPHVDEFRPVHSLEALADLCQALSRPAGPAHDPRRWIAAMAA
ncbi:MAG: VWA domain-containing protein [Pseudomonadota bacterium]|nr:VWA domain-containing protein [Pseudomonadota bacterium]